MKHTVNIDDVLTIRPVFGAGMPVTITVSGIGEKNGRPLFDYIAQEGGLRWAYETQIERRHHETIL